MSLLSNSPVTFISVCAFEFALTQIFGASLNINLMCVSDWDGLFKKESLTGDEVVFSITKLYPVTPVCEYFNNSLPHIFTFVVDSDHVHTHTIYTPLRAPLQCINQLWAVSLTPPEGWSCTHLSLQKQKQSLRRDRITKHSHIWNEEMVLSDTWQRWPSLPLLWTRVWMCACPLAVLRHRDLSHSIPTVYLDLSSDYRRALSLEIISCQEQLLLNAADNNQTCCSIRTAAWRENTLL